MQLGWVGRGNPPWCWPHLLGGPLPEAVQQDIQVGLQVLVVAIVEGAALAQGLLGRGGEGRGGEGRGGEGRGGGRGGEGRGGEGRGGEGRGGEGRGGEGRIT